MAEKPVVKIRKFESRDKGAVRRIFYDTAFIGEPASAFFEGRDAISDALTAYFTDYEPQSCFVAEAGEEVVGSLVGTKDKAAAEKIFSDKIAPGLFCKAFREGLFLKKKNIIFLGWCILDALKGRFITPDFTREYPASLHINVSRGFRGEKIGSGLMKNYLDYLQHEKVRGVHLATMSSATANFFTGLGFKLLHTSVRSYFRHILHQDVPLYIFGMKLLSLK
ncbi:MAG: GNAT family N-acetyltransferase [Candidatus Omnitrophota bacterium]|nr:GNAT family N-acetyltransferase [Candidatus Omnitrophota bacterium]